MPTQATHGKKKRSDICILGGLHSKLIALMILNISFNVVFLLNSSRNIYYP